MINVSASGPIENRTKILTASIDDAQGYKITSLLNDN